MEDARQLIPRHNYTPRWHHTDVRRVDNNEEREATRKSVIEHRFLNAFDFSRIRSPFTSEYTPERSISSTCASLVFFLTVRSQALAACSGKLQLYLPFRVLFPPCATPCYLCMYVLCCAVLCCAVFCSPPGKSATP